MPNAIRLDPRDNVATLIRDAAAAGEAVLLASGAPPVVHTAGAIAFGHKVALAAIAAGAPVLKYGQVIGLASRDIAPGEHVHSHNLESERARGDRRQEARP